MKKQHSYIGITFIILIFGIYVVRNLDQRFSDNEVIQDNRSKEIRKKQPAKNGLFSFNSVPNFEFTNQFGNTIMNKNYAGKVYVVAFFFSTCPSICPIMNDKMLTIQNEFAGNDNFGIASISITPEIDTPEILKEYAKKNGISHKNWHLLTGKSQEEVYDLSNKGFKLFAGKGDGEHGGFEHSGLFALVDKSGIIRSRKDEYGNPIMYYRSLNEHGFIDQINELKEDIKLLLNE